jgi:hypothetical protein
MIKQGLLRTWRSLVKMRYDRESDFFSFQRQGVKIEETVIVLDSKLRFYFNPLK